jgi:hypothetical protein
VAEPRARRSGWALFDAALRVSAALVGTLPPSVLLTCVAAAHLPISRGAALATGILAAIPLWIAAMCLAFIARHGWLVWIVCVAATAALAWAVPDAVFWPTLPH